MNTEKIIYIVVSVIYGIAAAGFVYFHDKPGKPPEDETAFLLWAILYGGTSLVCAIFAWRTKRSYAEDENEEEKEASL